MAAGGIYDHLGGGFARYSVDDVWLVPHFEKMLYDNALLIRALPPRLAAHRVPTGTARCSPRRSTTCCATCASPAAALARPRTPTARARRASSTSGPRRRSARCSATDADAAIAWYGVTPTGNFEHGTTILNRMHARGALARPAEIEAARAALFAARAHAGAPGARRQGAHRVERVPRGDARRGGRGVRTSRRGSPPPWRRPSSCSANLRRADGRWLRSWQADAGARHLAYATDHGALRRRLHPPGRGHRRGPLDRRGPRRRRRAARPLLGRRARRRVHHRPRRRGAHRPHRRT